MPFVYATHVPNKKTPEGDFIPSIDISPASEFGEIIVLSSGKINVFDTSTISRLVSVLRNFTKEDFLLPIGDPVMMCSASALLGRFHKRIKILRWDRSLFRYITCMVSS